MIPHDVINAFILAFLFEEDRIINTPDSDRERVGHWSKNSYCKEEDLYKGFCESQMKRTDIQVYMSEIPSMCLMQNVFSVISIHLCCFIF